MDYVYDILLNFQNKYYDFYEWKTDDKIINVKRIPIYKIDSKDYLNIKNNDVIINKECLPKCNKMFLITNGVEIMGILINENGKVNKKSSLIFEESDDILEDKDLIKFIKIEYQIDKKYDLRYISRLMEEKINYIDKYLKNIDKEDDKYFLKYLYYEIFNIDIDDIDKIYNDLFSLAKEDTLRMYDAIKRINLELKR